MASTLPATLVYPNSLGDTLDAINAAVFYQKELPASLRGEAAAWIADRQGLPGSYAGMFAPTEYDYAFGALTFTGDPVRSGAATGHVLSEEACGALYRLNVDQPAARQALERARQAIFIRMEQSEPQGKWAGVYCCGLCSVSLWRHLVTSHAAEDDRRLENGLQELHRYRDGAGRWKRFPFYYTLLALSEMGLPAARSELIYAMPVAERMLRRYQKTPGSEHDHRRRIVLERALEKC